MVEVYKFRVMIDYKEDVFRDIEILSNQTFEELHLIIQNAFEFDNSQMASFFMSNDAWDKGEEIGLLDMGDSSVKLMKDVVLSEKLDAAGQKVIYVFDFLLMWCFYVELIKIDKMKPELMYPNVVHAFGKSPKQYEKDEDNDFGSDFEDEYDLDSDDYDFDDDNDFDDEPKGKGGRGGYDDDDF